MNGLLVACVVLLALVMAVGLSLPALERVLYGAGHHRRPARLPRLNPIAAIQDASWSRWRRKVVAAEREAIDAEYAAIRDRLTTVPAPDAAPGQAQDAGPHRLPPADGPAPLPRPGLPPGPGQPTQRDTWVVFPDQQAWAAHRQRIDGLAAPGKVVETGGMIALVPGHLVAYEAWRDQAAVTL